MEEKREEPITSEVAHNGNGYGAAPRKGGIVNTLYPPGPRGGAGPRIKNHCRKFWWCDLLLLAIIVLIIVLPIVYVGIPHIAQHDLNESTLEVTEQDVTSPTPDSVHLKLVSVVKSSSSFHPTIDAFNASLSLPGKAPFAYLNVPQTKADASTTIVVDQELPFPDEGRFAEYNEAVMGSETFTVNFDGKTKLHQKGLKAISVNYNKVVTLKGLNKLAGLNITDISILNQTGSDGANMVGTVYIPNPSVYTVDLGNVTMNLAVDGKAIGTSLIPNMILKPGDNNLPMRSTVDQGTVITLITSKYTNAILPISIVGNSSIYNGQHLSYYEAAIKSNTININLNVGPALAAIGLNLGGS